MSLVLYILVCELNIGVLKCQNVPKDGGPEGGPVDLLLSEGRHPLLVTYLQVVAASLHHRHPPGNNADFSGKFRLGLSQ